MVVFPFNETPVVSESLFASTVWWCSFFLKIGSRNKRLMLEHFVFLHIYLGIRICMPRYNFRYPAEVSAKVSNSVDL
jgi:hypothetical protein